MSAEIAVVKHCPGCDQILPLASFHANGPRRQGRCIACTAAKRKAGARSDVRTRVDTRRLPDGSLENVRVERRRIR